VRRTVKSLSREEWGRYLSLSSAAPLKPFSGGLAAWRLPGAEVGSFLYFLPVIEVASEYLILGLRGYGDSVTVTVHEIKVSVQHCHRSPASATGQSLGGRVKPCHGEKWGVAFISKARRNEGTSSANSNVSIYHIIECTVTINPITVNPCLVYSPFTQACERNLLQTYCFGVSLSRFTISCARVLKLID
jgi:hypothetical protein